MKVVVRGDDITPERIAEVIHRCQRDHFDSRDLTVTGVVLYLRTEDRLGRTVEVLQEDGREITREFTFRKPRAVKEPQPTPLPRPDPVDPISTREMMQICSQAAHRALSAPEMATLQTIEKTLKPNRQDFVRALNQSLQQAGRFNVQLLEQLVAQHGNNANGNVRKFR